MKLKMGDLVWLKPFEETGQPRQIDTGAGKVSVFEAKVEGWKKG
jgi:hypothetical protein